MRNILFSIVLVLFFAIPSFALLDDNSTNLSNQQQQGQITDIDNSNRNTSINDLSNSNRNSQGQGQDQDQKQGQGQAQGQAAIAAQGQGQLGVVGQSAQNSQGTVVENKTEVHTFAPAPTAASTGTDNINASSPMFNAGISSTKKYIMLKEQYNLIQMMLADGYLTPEQAKIESNNILDTFKAETRRKKILGVIPFTRPVCDNAIVGAIPFVCN